MPNTSSLSHSPTEITRQLMLVADPSEQVFVGGEPPTPDDVITLFDTEGTSDGRIQINGQLQQHYGLQLRFRATDYPTGWRKANQWRTFLSEQVNQDVVTMPDLSQFLVWCYAKIGQVLCLGTGGGSDKRFYFTLNCAAPIEQIGQSPSPPPPGGIVVFSGDEGTVTVTDPLH